MKIRKAIIPAAGMGTRFLPATKSQPKEMLPIVDKPCIQYLVEEAVASGIKEIIIVLGYSKHSIKDHFTPSKELNAHLRKKGQTQIANQLKKIEKLAKISYANQEKPLGDGHAILCAASHFKDEPVAVLFGDDIYDSTVPPLAQLISQFNQLKTPIIALQKVPKSDTHKYGIIKPANPKSSPRLHLIENLIEKPSPSKAPSNLAIAGKYIITPELLKTLKKAQAGADGELRLIDGMRQYIKNSPIHGYEVEGQRFDTGDKLGYLKAVLHFGLKHPELKTDLKKYIKALDLK